MAMLARPSGTLKYWSKLLKHSWLRHRIRLSFIDIEAAAMQDKPIGSPIAYKNVGVFNKSFSEPFKVFFFFMSSSKIKVVLLFC